MRLIVDLSERHVRKIQQLTDEGRYESLNSFVRVAVENQLLLETEPELKDISRQGVEDSELLPRVTSHVRNNVMQQADWHEKLRGAVQTSVSTISLDEQPYDRPNTIRPSGGSTDMLPGLISRILPLKFGLRTLHCRLAETGEDTVKLDDFLETVGMYALYMGELLADRDMKAGRGREQAFATGFPRDNRDATRSMDRYRNLFICNLRSRDGKADGAIQFLKFSVVTVRGVEAHIGLTDAGYEFSRLSNPIIDGQQESESSLSFSERKFYLEHIERWAPGEFEATRLILTAIRDGIGERAELNDWLAQSWPQRWSPDQVNSWRSGLLARIVELGLLQRIRAGRSLEYRVSVDGHRFLDSNRAVS